MLWSAAGQVANSGTEPLEPGGQGHVLLQILADIRGNLLFTFYSSPPQIFRLSDGHAASQPQVERNNDRCLKIFFNFTAHDRTELRQNYFFGRPKEVQAIGSMSKIVLV